MEILQLLTNTQKHLVRDRGEEQPEGGRTGKSVFGSRPFNVCKGLWDAQRIKKKKKRIT